MAKILRKPRLLDLVIEAIHACGWDVLILSSREDHPFALSIFKGDTKISLLGLYLEFDTRRISTRPE